MPAYTPLCSGVIKDIAKELDIAATYKSTPQRITDLKDNHSQSSVTWEDQPFWETPWTLRIFKSVAEERKNVILQLQRALPEVKTLSGLLPICGSCKKIRKDEGYWEQLEIYIRDRTEEEFSHRLCTECAKKTLS